MKTKLWSTTSSTWTVSYTHLEVDMPTEYGHFRLIPFRQSSNGLEHMALIKGEWKEDEPIPVSYTHLKHDDDGDDNE